MFSIRKFKQIDTVMLFIVACLIGIGTVAIYSATEGTKYEGLHSNNIMLAGALIVPLLLISVVDYRIIVNKFAYVLYGIGILTLALVLFNGTDINGAERWLSIGSVQIQPSEIAKITTIIMVAHMLHKRNGKKLRLLKDIVPICLVFLLPVLFILKQPDLGTSIVFVGMMIGMIWMGNIRASQMIVAIIIGVVVVGTVIWMFYAKNETLSKVVKPHQMARIQTFLDPASDPDKAWHVVNSKNAIGSGAMQGEGFKNGFYIRNGFIPYAYSDSIYVVIGEEFGFLGSAVLLLLYFGLIYRMVLIAVESKHLSGSYIIVGVICMLVLQTFENIGMHIGLLPLTGIALPFISYGGSSLLTNIIAIGLVLSVKIHRNEYVSG
ncbi:FtsW/RodA/SpoVE family cell cycle protein [Paenibacillus mendelii]|uniref:FtsW/RodA/SpoVE family cell cycle protein n=1 Tax=Paenibacillus mendelii TaxID=206163 RepID=A0ABV6J5F0_9BACL|nr:FtsW/RodA/SpoVE family cell cycle protein [Paenibacillus mendelii]MCQ6560192.1 rod shape-determining protein RodA [Paenibacillus mendelii]